MEKGKGERYLASGRQYGNALLGVHHQEEEVSYQPTVDEWDSGMSGCSTASLLISIDKCLDA